jgi:hypothetical protein
MRIRDLRSQFRTRVLSSCTPAQAERYLQEIEAIVKDSPYDLSPGRCWIGPKTDTLLAFLDSGLVAALVMRSIALLDPLVFDPAGTPFPALLLNEMRLRAEGFLQSAGFEEYLFVVPGKADQRWLEALRRLGGTESLSASGLEVFRRRL